MSPQSAPPRGISRRAYAKRRGCDERAIRRFIESGALAGAILPDGTIDPDVADAKLSAAKIGGERVASNLVKARARKLGAAVALLRDEVNELGNAVAPVAVVDDHVRQIALMMAKILWPLADLAGRVDGMHRNEAMTVVEDAVRDRLEALAQTVVKSAQPKSRKPKDGRTLAEMTPIDLAAERATLQARKLEIERALRVGEMVRISERQVAAVDSVLRARNRLLGLHAHIGAHFADVVDASELAPVLVGEVRAALSELACNAVSAAEIEAARDQAIVDLPKRMSFKLQPQQGGTGT